MIPKEKIIEIINLEPEPLSPMPDYLWKQINGNKEETEQLIRITVMRTKRGILDKIKKL